MDPVEAPASGTEQGEGDSPAGAQNTDTPEGQAVPYTRFKEVNEARKKLEEVHGPYAELEQLGYDADSLRQLAEWEISFSTDPINNWMAIAEKIEGLPEPVRSAITQAKGKSPKSQPKPTPQAGEGGDDDEDYSDLVDDDEPPAWAQPLLEQHQRQELLAHQKAQDQLLEGILTKWREMDEKDNVKMTDMDRLMFLQSAQGSSEAELITSARDSALAMRERILGAAVGTGGKGTPPRSVPGGGAPGGSPPPPPSTLEEATKRAKAHLLQSGGE